MAKQLPMEELIKKYQNLTKSRQLLPTDDTNEKDRHMDYSKTSARSHDQHDESSSVAKSSEDACKLCLDAEANCAFIECGHIASCLNCAKLLTKCPICRATIKRTLRIYKS